MKIYSTNVECRKVFVIMKRLPDSELEIMLIVWDYDRPVTRFEIEERLDGDRKLSPTTILSFLARLQERGFLEVTKVGKNNLYAPVIDKDSYMKVESKNILTKLYRNSAKNFIAALYDGDNLSADDIAELEEYITQMKKGQ